MSNKITSNIRDNLAHDLEKAEEREIKKAELCDTETDVRLHKARIQKREIVKNDLESAIQRHINISPSSPVGMEEIIAESTAYFESAEDPLPMIFESLTALIPIHRKTIGLCLAPTGDGKSTIVGNIVTTILKDSTKPRRILILTNEETAFEVYTRICCLIKGWSYADHDKFTEAQKLEFLSFAEKCKHTGLLQVIDDSFGGATGITTTLEGVHTLLERIMCENHDYDLIILDYFQNVSRSTDFPTLSAHEVQFRLTHIIDSYKNKIKPGFMVMSQVRSSQDKSDFFLHDERLKGSREIHLKATTIVEVRANRSRYETTWFIHKSRHKGATGKNVVMGFEYGRFVELDEAFKLRRKDRYGISINDDVAEFSGEDFTKPKRRKK